MEHDTRGIAVERSLWKSVALPSEHGGWGLTLEPILLGLLVARSSAGALIGVAALLAFLQRTPVKLALIDRRRGRWLERSLFAARLATVEGLLMVSAALAAVRFAGIDWIMPVTCALPLVTIELWFDVRSRGRRLVPELCGAVGIASVAAAIAIAGGESTALAVGLWLLLAARSVAAIPLVRMQIMRIRRGSAAAAPSIVAQIAALVMGAVAVIVDDRLLVGACALGALVLIHLWWHRPNVTQVAAKVIGLRQMALGVALVVITAGGVWSS